MRKDITETKAIGLRLPIYQLEMLKQITPISLSEIIKHLINNLLDENKKIKFKYKNELLDKELGLGYIKMPLSVFYTILGAMDRIYIGIQDQTIKMICNMLLTTMAYIGQSYDTNKLKKELEKLEKLYKGIQDTPKQ